MGKFYVSLLTGGESHPVKEKVTIIFILNIRLYRDYIIFNYYVHIYIYIIFLGDFNVSNTELNNNIII